MFDQLDPSNWFHPLGFAYYPDGAHDGVDELEEGVGNGEQQINTYTCNVPNWTALPVVEVVTTGSILWRYEQ